MVSVCWASKPSNGCKSNPRKHAILLLCLCLDTIAVAGKLLSTLISTFNDPMKTKPHLFTIVAHPDDEAFGPAGYVHQQRQDYETHLIIVTDGAYARRYRHEPDIDARKEELERSAKLIGYSHIHQLPFRDGELSNNTYHQLAEAIQELVDQYTPEVLITFEPQGLSGHLDHIAVTSVVTYIFEKTGFVKKLMYFALSEEVRNHFDDYFVYMPSGYAREKLDLIVDISREWDIKEKAILAHKSQKTDGSRALEILKRVPKEEHFLIREKNVT